MGSSQSAGCGRACKELRAVLGQKKATPANQPKPTGHTTFTGMRSETSKKLGYRFSKAKLFVCCMGNFLGFCSTKDVAQVSETTTVLTKCLQQLSDFDGRLAKPRGVQARRGPSAHQRKLLPENHRGSCDSTSKSRTDALASRGGAWGLAANSDSLPRFRFCIVVQSQLSVNVKLDR